jgi:hypothetical protein
MIAKVLAYTALAVGGLVALGLIGAALTMMGGATGTALGI